MADSALRLLPAGGFRLFSDGYQLLWELGSLSPRMWRSDLFGHGTEIPLDNEHLHALVLPTGVWVKYDNHEPFLLGKPGQTLTVIEMLTDIERQLYKVEEQSGESNAKAFLAECGSPSSSGIGYYGMHPTTEPYSETCFEIHIRCF